MSSDFHVFQCPSCGAKFNCPNAPSQLIQCGKCGQVSRDVHYPSLIGRGYEEYWKFKGRYAVVKGSRASKKSKTIALWHIVNLMRYPLANALVVRKTERTLRDSCFADLKWSINRLGVSDDFRCSVNPLEITRISTGQKIIFRGCDDALKLTSITVPHGVLCWVWCEEAYEMTKEKDFDMLNESIRGEVPPGYFKRISISLNPWSSKHWIKRRFFDTPNDENKLAITTNYLINEWLDDSDRQLFEDMKVNNPTRYLVAGLGEWGISDGLVYENWEERDFDIDEMLKIPKIKVGCGLDFGWTDPCALCCIAIDENKKHLYVFDELYEQHLTNQELADRIIEMGYRKTRIIADSAEPKSIEELRQAGIIGIRPASKGRDSILHGIKTMQGYRIIIHPRCVNFITEISNYCWDKDKNGNEMEKPIDDFNHILDGCRYITVALSQGDRFSW